MNKLLPAIEEINAQIVNHNKSAHTISSSDVGWHLAHCLMIVESVFLVIKDSNPERYSPTFSLKKLLVLKIGFIPRGKVKAPKAVVPSNYDQKSLLDQVQTARRLSSFLVNFSENQYFNHPFLGHLNIKDTKRFLEVHTHHHLKIVNDILKNG